MFCISCCCCCCWRVRWLHDVSFTSHNVAQRICCNAVSIIGKVHVCLQIYRTEKLSRKLPPKSTFQLMSVSLTMVAVVSAASAFAANPGQVSLVAARCTAMAASSLGFTQIQVFRQSLTRSATLCAGIKPDGRSVGSRGTTRATVPVAYHPVDWPCLHRSSAPARGAQQTDYVGPYSSVCHVIHLCCMHLLIHVLPFCCWACLTCVARIPAADGAEHRLQCGRQPCGMHLCLLRF
jgi:hypothetical protein